MFCSNCGQRFEGNFCPNCGARAGAAQQPAIPPLRQPYFLDVGGRTFDVHLVIRCYGLGLQRSGTYNYVSEKAGVPVSMAKQALEPIVRHHIDAGETVSLAERSKARFQLDVSEPAPMSKRQRIRENRKSGVACCPKCGSTSLSSNRRGFGFGKAAVGVFAVGAIGAVAGSAGAKKVEVTCLSCGHRWTM